MKGSIEPDDTDHLKPNNHAVPLVVPRSPMVINPFSNTTKVKVVHMNDPLDLGDAKPQRKHSSDNHKRSTNERNKQSNEKPAKELVGTQLLYLDTDNVEILPTQNNDYEETKMNKIKTLIDVIGDGDDNKGSFEDGLKTKAYYSRYLLIDQAVSAFSFLSIIIALIEYDLEFEEREEFVAQSMLWMTFILTIGMVLLTVVRSQAKLDWLKTRKIIPQKENLITAGYLAPMIIEIIISAVHPMPWTWNQRIEFYNEPVQADVYYHLNEILLLIMLLRALMIIRTLLMMSVWYNNRTQRVCQMYACESDYLFVVKCIMQKQPYFLVTCAMTISIFYFGFAIRICEAPLMRVDTQQRLLFFSFWNSIWNVIVTLTTVGYGDYYAQTLLGRFIIFFLCIWGVLIVSMMLLTLNATIQIQPLEQKAIAVLDRLALRAQMKEHAASVLTLLAKIGLSNRKGKFEGSFKKQIQMKLKKALTSFKIAQRQYRSINDENVSEEMVIQLIHSLCLNSKGNLCNSFLLNIQKGRQFDFLRDDLKVIFERQNAVLESTIQLMQQFRVDQNEVEYYQKFLPKSSILINPVKEIKSDPANIKMNLNGLAQHTMYSKPNITEEEISEKGEENEANTDPFPAE